MTLNSSHRPLNGNLRSPFFLYTSGSLENNAKVPGAGRVFLAVVTALLTVTYAAISLSGTQAEIRASLHPKTAQERRESP